MEYQTGTALAAVTQKEIVTALARLSYYMFRMEWTDRLARGFSEYLIAVKAMVDTAGTDAATREIYQRAFFPEAHVSRLFNEWSASLERHEVPCYSSTIGSYSRVYRSCAMSLVIRNLRAGLGQLPGWRGRSLRVVPSEEVLASVSREDISETLNRFAGDVFEVAWTETTSRKLSEYLKRAQRDAKSAGGDEQARQFLVDHFPTLDHRLAVAADIDDCLSRLGVPAQAAYVHAVTLEDVLETITG